MKTTITDDDGCWRFGRLKGTPLRDVPDHVLGEVNAWAQRIVKETQEVLDKRLADLRRSEGEE